MWRWGRRWELCRVMVGVKRNVGCWGVVGTKELHEGECVWKQKIIINIYVFIFSDESHTSPNLSNDHGFIINE